MIQYFKTLKQNTKGQAVTEFALALPIVLFLFLGMLDSSWLSTSQMQITTATQEAAKTYVSMVNSDTTYTKGEVDQILKDIVIENANTVDPQNIHIFATQTSENFIKVIVNVRVKSLTGFSSRDTHIKRSVVLKTQ